MKRPELKKWAKRFWMLVLVGALTFVGLSWCVHSGAHTEISGEPQIMVVLGCQVYPWGPSILLQDRLDTALEYLEDHPDMTVVVSGGKGTDEHISEAQCMYNYLAAEGFPVNQIIMEDHSFNTYENMIFTAQLLDELEYDLTQDVLVVSNGFHLTRARMLWERVTGTDDNLSTLAAPSSHIPSRVKMYIREPLALVKSFVFDRG